MKLSRTILLLASLSLPFVRPAPPCSAPRSWSYCVGFLRPYSDNEYDWKTVCNITVPPNTLISTDIEMYDDGYDCSSGHFATCCVPQTDPFVHCGVVDCDGPESALPPARNDIPTGWTTVVPCAIDNPQRVLANPVVTYLNSTTPYSCISQCSAQGYRYAGVEYGDECYCGTGYAGGVLPPAADVSECDMRCAGSFMNTCGGSWRMQIYKADGSP